MSPPFAPMQSDIWSSIQSKKPTETIPEPYIHPLLRRSSSLMSQHSLEIITESLGSETGSDDYFSEDDLLLLHSSSVTDEQEEHQETEIFKVRNGVNYHSAATRKSPTRLFPPPLPSISRRDGPCFQMRPHREDGRLVVSSVPVPSKNYLQAERVDGRLVLSFIHTATRNDTKEEQVVNFEDEEEVEEEVEVVDRGTIVEVKASGSSIVINKFVSYHHDKENNQNILNTTGKTTSGKRAATTAAAAAVAASSMGVVMPADGDDKLLLVTSKRRNRERDMRRCIELRKPLFIWEPASCIATSI